MTAKAQKYNNFTMTVDKNSAYMNHVLASFSGFESKKVLYFGSLII
jgi:hypothetical protein